MKITKRNRNVVMTEKRLAVNLPCLMHNELRKRAAERNIPIRKWIMNAIIQAMKREDKYN